MQICCKYEHSKLYQNSLTVGHGPIQHIHVHVVLILYAVIIIHNIQCNVYIQIYIYICIESASIDTCENEIYFEKNNP